MRIELRDSRIRLHRLCAQGLRSPAARSWWRSGARRASPAPPVTAPNYKGNGEVPPLAGRSPSQIVRQLYDFKSGTRNGAGRRHDEAGGRQA